MILHFSQPTQLPTWYWPLVLVQALFTKHLKAKQHVMVFCGLHLGSLAWLAVHQLHVRCEYLDGNSIWKWVRAQLKSVFGACHKGMPPPPPSHTWSRKRCNLLIWECCMCSYRYMNNKIHSMNNKIHSMYCNYYSCKGNLESHLNFRTLMRH